MRTQISARDMSTAIARGCLILPSGKVFDQPATMFGDSHRRGYVLDRSGTADLPQMFRVVKLGWEWLGKEHDLMAVQLRGDGTVWGKWFDDGTWINFTYDTQVVNMVRFLTRGRPGRYWINSVMRLELRPKDFNWTA